MSTTFKASLKRQLYELIMHVNKFEIGDDLLIFGDPRGGTTWLMELLGTIKGTILVDEPLHLRDGCLPAELNFGWRQAIPRNAEWLAAKEAFEAMLNGKQLSLSALRHNGLTRILGGSRLVFKFTRGNALLPWLCQQFELTYSPIYLLRHPVAVASSQIRNFPTSSRFRVFEIPDTPYNEIYKEHSIFLQHLDSRLQQLVALWCIHNYQTLAEPPNKWIKVHYEQLMLTPETVLKAISESWGMPFPSKMFDNITVPSYSDVSHDLRRNKMEQIEKWHGKMGNEELEKIQRILDHFGITDYQAHVIMPMHISSWEI